MRMKPESGQPRPFFSAFPHKWNSRVDGSRTAYKVTKRVFDVVGSAALLVAFAPILVAVFLLVRGTSRGPALFRQTRVGRDQQPFTILKFRTMHVDAEARLIALGMYERYVLTDFKLDAIDECRLTSAGRFLRATSLDELPQLFNVLLGHMSLVGPRPVVPQELSSYGSLLYCYTGLRPGLTGMWQVWGRSHIRFPERAHLDLQYFEQVSLRVDLGILIRTPAAVLRGTGAH